MAEPTPLPVHDDARWRAVLARDGRCDGAFVHAVRSTGVFCHPSCPSRRPRRPQVTFFAVPEAAEHVGFRPCKRCRPQDTPPVDPRIGRPGAARAVGRACAANPVSLVVPCHRAVGGGGGLAGYRWGVKRKEKLRRCEGAAVGGREEKV